VYERSLNSAEFILSAQKDSLLTVRKVWEEVVKLSKTENFEVASLPDFSAMLDGDKRFQIVPAQLKVEDTEEEVPSDIAGEDAALGQLGFFPEDRVRLRYIPVAPPEPTEAEEEVGSIRRRAFVTASPKVKKEEPTPKGKKVKPVKTKKTGAKKKITPKKKAKPAARKKVAKAKPVKKRKPSNRKKK
jgi:hypothetical protein